MPPGLGVVGGIPTSRAGGRRSSSSSVNKGSGLLGAVLPDAFGGRFPPVEPWARSSCLINGEWTKWI